MKWLGELIFNKTILFCFVLHKKGQGVVIQGSARVVCITEIYGIVGSSNYIPLKTTTFCHLLKYLQPRRQRLELLLDSRPLPRASSSGSGWLSAIIPQTHGLYHVYNN